MTRNEARADNNLPPIEGGDELIVPLNVVTGGQASPTDTHNPNLSNAEVQSKSAEIRIKGIATEEESKSLEEIISKFIKRQKNAILPRLGAGAEDWWDIDRWNSELADDLEPIFNDIADAHGIEASDIIGNKYDSEITRAYLRKMAEGRADATNVKTKRDLDASIEADEDVADTFDKRESKSTMLGQSLATAVAGWSVLEACRQAEYNGFEGNIQKVWVTGANPRPSHAAMNGERVDYDKPFSNGADWPGDDVLSPDESCGCNCSVEVIIS